MSNTDEPDGCRYFWHNLRKTQEVVSKSYNGEATVMIFDAFAAYEKMPVIFIDYIINSSKYVDMFGENFLLQDILITSSDFIFLTG
ncbi:hypothetical protein NPIL_142211 [Nephila pilipes]|uniref:Uncharacterized protein n=1 Tax=Nephila pilipes TaxID=299642 RepID=A0A8X6N370_NEPPI|nr:hypothetical protein NPIL_142211 [Nephila pilipes]